MMREEFSTIIDGIKLDIRHYDALAYKYYFVWHCPVWHHKGVRQRWAFSFLDTEVYGIANYDCYMVQDVMKEYPTLKDYVERFLALGAFT
jgi:hypothetical protein